MNTPENPIGNRFTELVSIGSTNELARQWIEQAVAQHGDVLFTWEQTAGRGQMGKHWLSEARKNLAMTILLKNALLPDTTPFHLSVCAALACQEVLTVITGGDVNIKWPNDLYWKNRKLGGLLIEILPAWSMVGIGINVNQTAFDPSLPNPVSLRQICGKEHDLQKVAQEIIVSFNTQMDQWAREGFPALLKKYRTHFFGKGNTYTIRENGEERRVTIVDVEETGGLLIEQEGSIRTVRSGIEWIIHP